MSKIAKICLALSILSFIAAGILRVILTTMGPGV